MSSKILSAAVIGLDAEIVEVEADTGGGDLGKFLIVGLPALFKPLSVDELTYIIGLPVLAISTLLFVISGISKKIHIWEGAMYLLIYILFILKLIGIL